MRPTNLPLILHNWSATGRDGSPQGLPAGDCLEMLSGAALFIGDFVYISAANTVNKSAVAATVAAAPLGVVVAGYKTNGQYPYTAAPVGVPAFVACDAAGQQVVVQYDGLALVYCTGALAAGGTVIPGATAGQVVAGSTAGQIVGFNVGAVLAGAGWALIKLEHR
jgi:hypothetical protein